MSSLIEQAALRLEQLRRAGAEMPAPSPAAEVAPASVAGPAVADVPQRAAQPAAAEAPPAPVQKSKSVEIDLDALASAGIVSPNAPRSQIADQYRVIKRPLIANAMGRPIHWSADKLAWTIGLRDEQRTKLKITTIGAIDCNKDQRQARRNARKAERERSRRAAAKCTTVSTI